MDIFQGLIDNPNFGRAFRGSKFFQEVFQRYVDIHPDVDVARMRNRIRVDVDESGALQFVARDLNYRYQRGSGESYSDFMHRLVTGERVGTSIGGKIDPFSPSEGMPLEYLRSAEMITGDRLSTDVASNIMSSSFGQYRRGIEAAARRSGATVRLRTFNAEEEVLERIVENVGKRRGVATGLIMPSDDQISVLEMFDRGGRKLDLNEIYRAFQIDPENKGVFFKRMRTYLNRQLISESMSAGQLRVGEFDPQDLFSKNPKNVSRLATLIDNARQGNPDFDADGFTSGMYQRMADGQSLMSRSAFNRRMAYLDKEIQLQRQNLARLVNNGMTGGAEHKQVLKYLKELETTVSTLRSDVTRGLSFNIRASGGTDILNPTSSPSFFKGDVIVVDDGEFRKVVRLSTAHAGMTDEEIDRMDLFASRFDRKSELGLFGGGDAFMSLTPQGMPKTAYSNSLTLATFGDFVNPIGPDGQSLMGRSLQASIDDAIESMYSGKLSPALISMIDDLERISPDDFDDPAEYLQAMRTQRYAIRIRDFVQGGGDIRSNDVMMKDLIRVVREHHFTYRRYKNTIQFGDEQVKDLSMRVPMLMSTRAHMLNRDLTSQMVSENVMENPGMAIVVDYDKGARFGLGALDAAISSTPWGGSDWDDSLYISYRYDSKAKRLMALTLRDPNTLGEYMMLEADITLDKNFARRTTARGNNVQALSRRRKALLRDVGSIAKPGRDLSELSQKEMDKLYRAYSGINEINQELDEYFQSAESQIQGMDIKHFYGAGRMEQTYAPNGWMVNDTYGQSMLRGYGVEDLGQRDEFIRRLSASVAAEAKGDHNMPFKFVNDQFRDYLDGPNGRAYYRRLTDLPEVEALTGRMTTEAIESRARVITRSRGLLGRGVNVTEAINNFIASHTNNIQNGFDRQTIEKVIGVMSENPITIIDRELFIDTAVKTGSDDMLRATRRAIDNNVIAFGKILGGLHNAGIANAGIDPALLEQRFNLPKDRELLMQGYKSVVPDAEDMSMEDFVDRIRLAIDDPKAGYSRTYREILDAEARLGLIENEMTLGASERYLEDLAAGGFDATDVERERARQFLEGYYQDKSELLGPQKSPEQLERLMRDALDSPEVRELIDSGGDLSGLFSEYTRDEVNFRSLQRLQRMGILEDHHALNRQLLAIGQVASEARIASEDAFSALEPLEQISTIEGRPSISRLANRAAALNRASILNESISSAAADFQGGDIAAYLSDFIGAPTIDTVARDQEILRGIEYMRTRNGHNYHELANQLMDNMGITRGDFEANLQTALRRKTLAQSAVETIDLSPRTGGAIRFSAREGADSLADEVVTHTTMKRLGMQEIASLLSKPGFRKGLGAAAIFAGLGLVHELRGERSPEDIQGPPLLPGGSSYEEYQGFDPQSIYSTAQSPTFGQMGQGVTYTIKANGAFDPYALGSQIGSLTGASVNGTISQGRRTINRPGSTSAEILNSRYE